MPVWRILIFIIVLISLGFIFKKTNFLGLGTGEAAPDFSVQNLDGKSLQLSEVLRDKIVVLHFWATWCGTCQQEMPVLNELSRSLDASRVQFLGVMTDHVSSLDQARRLFEKFQKKIPVEFDVAFDTSQKTADEYRVYQIPETFLIGRAGIILAQSQGPLTELSVKLWQKKIAEESVAP